MKAENEISKAQKLISEKDAELQAAEESLSGLKEVQHMITSKLHLFVHYSFTLEKKCLSAPLCYSIINLLLIWVLAAL